MKKTSTFLKQISCQIIYAKINPKIVKKKSFNLIY
jgi:hypothetical protein